MTDFRHHLHNFIRLTGAAYCCLFKDFLRYLLPVFSGINFYTWRLNLLRFYHLYWSCVFWMWSFTRCCDQIGQEGPLVHIGGAIASELTWMHGRPPIRERSVLAPQTLRETWRNKRRELTPKAWIFVSKDIVWVNSCRNASWTVIEFHLECVAIH